jgi:metal-dependent amidase/aminoacylase/carboxypeptidase family protein
MTTRTQELAAGFAGDIVALRRDLHQNPEIGLDLPQTQQRILDALAPLDLEITLGKGLSSVTAVLRGGKPSEGDRPVVLLRGDMDGLPVDELVDVPFASTNGAMHACGHDLHVAGLVGAAKILHAMRDDLAGDVVFMFQPGEEGPGGAKPDDRRGPVGRGGQARRCCLRPACDVGPGAAWGLDRAPEDFDGFAGHPAGELPRPGRARVDAVPGQ